MKDSPMQWSQSVPTMSRLDCIATAIYCITNMQNIDYPMTWSEAVRDAKALIAELDKEQQQ